MQQPQLTKIFAWTKLPPRAKVAPVYGTAVQVTVIQKNILLFPGNDSWLKSNNEMAGYRTHFRSRSTQEMAREGGGISSPVLCHGF